MRNGGGSIGIKPGFPKTVRDCHVLEGDSFDAVIGKSLPAQRSPGDRQEKCQAAEFHHQGGSDDFTVLFPGHRISIAMKTIWAASHSVDSPGPFRSACCPLSGSHHGTADRSFFRNPPMLYAANRSAIRPKGKLPDTKAHSFRQTNGELQQPRCPSRGRRGSRGNLCIPGGTFFPGGSSESK